MLKLAQKKDLNGLLLISLVLVVIGSIMGLSYMLQHQPFELLKTCPSMDAMHESQIEIKHSLTSWLS